MNTQEKCEAIIRKMIELANESGQVLFEEDFGGNSITIVVGNSHTHVGYPDAPFELLVNNIYDSLHGGPGLSWEPNVFETGPHG
jgi:hypothetical protein